MSPKKCRPRPKIFVAAAIMLLPIALSACRHLDQPCQPGYLILSRGQTYQAQQDETWASLRVIEEKDQQIILLQEAVRKLQAHEALGPIQ